MNKLSWEQLIYIAKKMKFPFYLDVVNIAKLKIKNNERHIDVIKKTNNVEIMFGDIYSVTEGVLFIISIVGYQYNYWLAVSLYDDGSYNCYNCHHYQDYTFNVHGLLVKKNCRRKYFWNNEILK